MTSFRTHPILISEPEAVATGQGLNYPHLSIPVVTMTSFRTHPILISEPEAVATGQTLNYPHLSLPSGYDDVIQNAPDPHIRTGSGSDRP
ncbi:MAG TPA: hypothetical protein VGJ66_14170, partial [Pyrinomonadaceae bacterium]